MVLLVLLTKLNLKDLIILQYLQQKLIVRYFLEMFYTPVTSYYYHQNQETSYQKLNIQELQ